MDNVYKSIIKEVYSDYKQKGIINDDVDITQLQTEIVSKLNLASYKCKISDDNVSAKSKSSDKNDKPKCSYIIVTQNGKNKKECGQLIKKSFSKFCDKHARLESGSSPETYLRSRFNDIFESKCSDITESVKGLKSISVELKSKEKHYKMYVIYMATEKDNAIYYSVHTSALGWNHGIAALVSNDDEKEVTTDEQSLKNVSDNFKIPISDRSTVQLLEKDMQSIKTVIAGSVKTE